MSHTNLPTILVTGASGFVGRYFVDAIKNEFIIHALARRPQQEIGIPIHQNIKWYLVDIAHRERLEKVFHEIAEAGAVDYVFHLAGYYDFGNEPNPEYQRTNIDGSRNILELTKDLKVKRFIFASSIAACNFPEEGDALTEKSPVDADYPYAWSKREGEKMVAEISELFPCTIVRFAAVFSDWCEYGVLYMFLKTWCSRAWNSKVLGGQGQSAIPFIHINDLINLVRIILQKSDDLPALNYFMASPDGCVTHQELYDLSTRLYFGAPCQSFRMPKWPAMFGIYLRDLFGRLIGNRPFERPWMMKYIDLKLNVDASITRKTLDWAPKPRRSIMRRLIYLIEHFKGNPTQWHFKNSLALKLVTERPNLAIAAKLESLKPTLIEQIYTHIVNPELGERFPNYKCYDEQTLKWYIEIYYNLLASAVRSGDRMALVNYARFLASIRSREGFSCEEVSNVFLDQCAIIIPELLAQPELKDLEMRVHDSIRLTNQLAVDEIEDAFEAIELSSRK